MILISLPKVAELLPVCFSCFPLSGEPKNIVRVIWLLDSLVSGAPAAELLLPVMLMSINFRKPISSCAFQAQFGGLAFTKGKPKCILTFKSWKNKNTERTMILQRCILVRNCIVRQVLFCEFSEDTDCLYLSHQGIYRTQFFCDCILKINVGFQGVPHVELMNSDCRTLVKCLC